MVHYGDITKVRADCIVNAAKASLLGGDGVDGAIHLAAGEKLKEECRKLGGCNVGEAKITKGHKLPAKYIIHTVGPQDKDGRKLKQCYLSSLKLMKANKLRTIAFPAIATGVYGYPEKEACQIACSTVQEWLKSTDNASSVDKIVFCVNSVISYDRYQEQLVALNPQGLAQKAPSRS